MALERIGKYQVLEEIASGAQGAVYRAFDPSNGMTVAVKVLHAQYSNDESFVERFRRDASLIQAIDHENVVKIFGVGESDGLYFMALEFIPGSLSSLIEITGSLSTDRAVAMAIGISAGIGQAHAQGIIHRDIKPQNVLLTPEGVPKVTDFGIARDEALETMTVTGVVMGTPYYMAPELAEGNRADSRSDVYSLGCLLYRLLSGEVPFAGETPVAILRRHLDDTPVALKKKVPSVPDSVVECVEKSMAKEPSERYSDANEFATALRGAMPDLIVQPSSSATVTAGSYLGAPAGNPPPPSTTSDSDSPDEKAISQWLVAILIIVIGLTVILVAIKLGNDDRDRLAAAENVPASNSAPSAVGIDSDSVVIDIYSSNTKENWINAIVEQFNQEVHKIDSGEPIIVRANHVTSGGSQRDILDGKIEPTVWSPGDSSWVDRANVVWRDRAGRSLVAGECPSTVLAPSGFAMWRPMAEALGWPDEPISWDDLVALSADPDGWASLGHPEWGQFKFGHAHPTYSNVGLQMMTALAYSTVGITTDLTPEQVYSDDVVEAFTQVENNTYRYGIQSRNLINLMVLRGPDYLHAVTTSEAETLKTNFERGDQLRFQLVFIFPAEGTFWSEHPYCILDTEWVSNQQSEAAEIFREYLLDPASQALAIDNYLRPVDQSIKLHAPLAIDFGTDPRITKDIVPALSSPSAVTAEAVKDVFFQTKKKATVVLLLDTSGSMGGDKIKSAVGSASGFISRLDPDDEIHIMVFDDSVRLLPDGGPAGFTGEVLSLTLTGLIAGGSTRLHDAVCEATEFVASIQSSNEAAGERRLYGIVLLSDGEDTASVATQNVMFGCLPTGENVSGVKIFTIAYGADADADLMLRIANRTNGSVFTGDPENIEKIYNAISAEQ